MGIGSGIFHISREIEAETKRRRKADRQSLKEIPTARTKGWIRGRERREV
jgi:hypothetical protein